MAGAQNKFYFQTFTLTVTTKGWEKTEIQDTGRALLLVGAVNWMFVGSVPDS